MDFYSKLDAGKRPLDYTKDQDNNLTHCNVAAKFKVEILVFGPNRIRLVTKGIRLIHTHTQKEVLFHQNLGIGYNLGAPHMLYV